MAMAHRRGTSSTSATAALRRGRADLRCRQSDGSSTRGPGADVSVNDLAAAIEPDPARIVHVEHIHPQSEIAVLRCEPAAPARSSVGSTNVPR